MSRKKLAHQEMKVLVLKVVADCRVLAEEHIRNWQPVNKEWPTLKGSVYLRLSDDTQVAVERGSLEQQIHIAISEAQYRSEQERMNYRITEFYIEPGITGRHGNRPEFIRLQHGISQKKHSFVIFKEISRLVRDLEIWKRFFRLCQKYDCEICIRGLPFNPNDPASILQLDQLAAFAEFESRTTSKRVKESNHSALLTSGKFNSHFPLLGFDALKNERGEYTGIYAPNKEELKQVEWVMTSFLNVDRYNVLLDRCKEKGIKTKLGKDFTRKSIRTLLTNPRYIGKWYRNKHNAGKRQSKLMPYERYAEVDLGHGCVIDKALWLRVQGKVKELDESRTRATKHCYPLSGLLVFSDGSHFIGSSAWGETRRSTYYHNMSNKIRVRSEVFDTEAAKILLQIAEDSRAFQKNIADYSTRKESSIGMVSSKIAEIDTKLGEIEADKRQLDKRLNFLLEDDDLEMARSFKDEYRSRFLALKSDEQVLIDRKRKLQQLQQQLTKKQEPTRSASGSLDLPPLSSSNANEWLGHTHEAINYIKKKDWLSLKSTYRQLFKKIIVQPLNSERVQLEFVFNNPSTPENSGVDIFCVSGDRAHPERLERPTPRFVVSYSIQLSYGCEGTRPSGEGGIRTLGTVTHSLP